MKNLPSTIASKVDEIMASAQARFGHGAFVMQYKNIPTEDDLRGKTPGELEVLARNLEGHLRGLHQTPLGELRTKTQAEQDEFDEGARALDLIATRLDASGKLRDQLRTGRGVVRPFGALAGGADAFAHEAAEVLRMAGDTARDAAQRVLEDRGRHLSAEQGDHVDKLLRSVVSEDNPNTDGSYVAKRILLTESPAYRSAFQRVTMDPRPILTGEEAEALRALEQLDRVEYRAMAEGTGSTGGFGVPAFIDPTIIMSAQGSLNPILELASRPQITTNVWKGVSSDGVTWSFDPEASTVSDDSPTLAQPSIPVFTARGFIPYSIEVGEDYPGFAQEMSQLLTEGYNELLANKLTVGSGTAEPLGLVTALDADAAVEVLLTTAGTLAAGDIAKVWAALPDRYKAQATWLASFAVIDKITALQVGSNPILNAIGELRQRPVRGTSYMTDLTNTSHTNVAVVGDLSKYVAPQRTGMSVELIPHLFDVTNNRPTGQRGWFAYARVGGAPSTTRAFRLLNQA